MSISKEKSIRYSNNRPDGELMRSHHHWKWFQPNNHRTGDCVIRSHCKFFNQTWLEAFDALVPIARAKQENLGRIYLDSTGDIDQLNLKWHSIPIQKGKKRITVEDFCKKHPEGRYICKISNHVVCVKDGFYWDIWECGDSALYGYWTD